MTKAEYDDAMAELEAIWDKPGQAQRMIDLADKIVAYELEHFPIPAPTPEEAAAFRAEQESGQLEQSPGGDEQAD